MINYDVPLNSRGLNAKLKGNVLDGEFAQSYDYQHYLRKTPNHEIALDIYNKVQAIMKQLSDCRIISGYVLNDYI